MRHLSETETIRVAGGCLDFGGDGAPVCGGDGGGETASKNNNGYGNGAESGPAPGRSGLHNPQLLEANLGPLGVR